MKILSVINIKLAQKLHRSGRQYGSTVAVTHAKRTPRSSQKEQQKQQPYTSAMQHIGEKGTGRSTERAKYGIADSIPR